MSYKTLSAPIMVQWEVTPNCNHNCVHCYNHWRTKEPVIIRGSHEITLYESVIKEIISNRVFAVNITGGEPLMVIKQIAPFVKKLSDNGVHLTMNSNLTLLTEAKAQLIKDCGIKSILVSVPSGNAKTCDQITEKADSLQQIIRGISIAKEAGIRIFTNMVVSRVNKDQIEETARLITSLGLDYFAVTRASDPSENKDFSSEILNGEEFCRMQRDLENAGMKFGLTTNSLEVNPPCAYGGKKPKQGYKFCNAGKTTCTIGFDGVVKPCNRVDMPYGHISDGLQSSWLKMADWRTDKWLPKACGGCSTKAVCGGGCKADAIKAHGDITMPDPLRTDAPIPQDHKVESKVLINYTQGFKVNPSLQWRPEEFGSILFLSLNNWVPIDHNLSALLQKSQTVTENDIAHALSTDNNSVHATIDVLVKKAMLLEQKT